MKRITKGNRRKSRTGKTSEGMWRYERYQPMPYKICKDLRIGENYHVYRKISGRPPHYMGEFVLKYLSDSSLEFWPPGKEDPKWAEILAISRLSTSTVVYWIVSRKKAN